MKNFICFLLVIMSTYTVSVAQKKKEKTPRDTVQFENADKTYFYGNPLGFFGNNFEVAIEHDLANHNSIVLSAGVTMVKNSGALFSSNNEKTDRSGFSGELQYRINMSKHPRIRKGLNAFSFFAPYVRGAYQDIAETKNVAGNTYNGSYYITTNNPVTVNSIVRSFGSGMLFGLRLFSTENRFTVTFFCGGGMKVSDVLGNSDFADIYRVGYTGVIPRAGLHVGISF